MRRTSRFWGPVIAIVALATVCASIKQNGAISAASPPSADGPWMASSNLSVDLAGAIDTRPSTWGTADFYDFRVSLAAPGKRVRVLRIVGDLVAWPRVLPGELPVAAGQYAGVLVGFMTTAADGSARCVPCADNTMVYAQGAMGALPIRVPFEREVSVGGLLGADGVLVVRIATWLNSTGRPVHAEATFTVTWRAEAA